MGGQHLEPRGTGPACLRKSCGTARSSCPAGCRSCSPASRCPEALAQLRRALRMDEQQHAELLRFGPDRWNFGSANPRRCKLPPTAAPRRPRFLTACSSCCTASSGYCSATDAKATNRSGWVAHNSARRLFWIASPRAASRVLAVPGRVDAEHLHVDALLVHRLHALSTTMKCSGMPFTGGSTPLACSPIRSIASWKKQCVCTSMVLTLLRPPPHRRRLRRLRARGFAPVQQPAAAEHQAGQRAAAAREEGSAVRRHALSPVRLGFHAARHERPATRRRTPAAPRRGLVRRGQRHQLRAGDRIRRSGGPAPAACPCPRSRRSPGSARWMRGSWSSCDRSRTAAAQPAKPSTLVPSRISRMRATSCGCASGTRV